MIHYDLNTILKSKVPIGMHKPPYLDVPGVVEHMYPLDVQWFTPFAPVVLIHDSPPLPLVG